MKKHIHFLIIVAFLLSYRITRSQINEPAPPLSSFSNDTGKINKLSIEGDTYIRNGKIEEALDIAKLMRPYSTKIGYKKGIGLSYNLEAVVLNRKGLYDSALSALGHVLIIGKEINDSSLQSSAYINMGNAYAYQGSNTLAIDYYFKGLAIEERLQVQPSLKWYFSNIGFIFTNQKNYPKALEYTKKAKEIAEKRKDEKSLGMILNNIGWIYILMNKNDSALYAIEQGLKQAEKTKDHHTLILCLGNLSEIHTTFKNYDKAYEYSYRAHKLALAKGYKDQIAINQISLGHIELERGNYNEAERHLMYGLKTAKEINARDLIKSALEYLAAISNKKGDFKSAYTYYKAFSDIKDTLLNQENSKLITEMNTKYTTEKKEKEIELLKKNEDIQKLELSKRKNELDKQRTISIGVFVGFLLLMVVAVLLFSRYRLKKKANDQLQMAFNLIEEKNVVIEKSNVLITDSITYAKRIQDAILPANEDITRLLSNDFFIFYQPAHIVSGDFYWCSAQGDKTIFVVADCTGHGVPGAFMSMIGNTLLNEIVNERKVTDTKEIANLLDQKIIHALHQEAGSDKYDGMDISICCMDKKKNEVTFTGAHHAMYALNGHLQKIKGDAYAIGGAQQQNAKVFTSQTISYEEGLNLYFLTDGYCDQSGGADNKRFSSKKFETLLEEVKELKMEDQKEKLKLAFENWKGETKQRDDVLVVGIKC